MFKNSIAVIIIVILFFGGILYFANQRINQEEKINQKVDSILHSNSNCNQNKEKAFSGVVRFKKNNELILSSDLNSNNNFQNIKISSRTLFLRLTLNSANNSIIKKEEISFFDIHAQDSVVVLAVSTDRACINWQAKLIKILKFKK